MKRRARKLDRKDLQILQLLQLDGRMTIAALARQVHLSPTPCYERVRRLERERYIRGYSAVVAPKPLGIAMLAFVEVRVERTTPDSCALFRSAVIGFKEVVECYMVTGEIDFLIKLRTRDLEAYRQFLAERLSRLPGVARTHSYVVVDEIKVTLQSTIEDACLERTPS